MIRNTTRVIRSAVVQFSREKYKFDWICVPRHIKVVAFIFWLHYFKDSVTNMTLIVHITPSLNL